MTFAGNVVLQWSRSWKGPAEKEASCRSICWPLRHRQHQASPACLTLRSWPDTRRCVFQLQVEVHCSTGRSRWMSIPSCRRSHVAFSVYQPAQQSDRDFSSVGHSITDVRSRLGLSASKVEAIELVRWGLRAGLLDWSQMPVTVNSVRQWLNNNEQIVIRTLWSIILVYRFTRSFMHCVVCICIDFSVINICV